MDITLRPYRSEDAQAVYDLHILSLKSSGAYIESPPELRGVWDHDLLNIEETYVKDGEFLIAEAEGKMVGMGALKKIDDETAEVKRMRVDPSCQGQGIGKQILDTLIKDARTLGFKRLILDTAIMLKAAQHLYESRGFTEYKPRDVVYGQEMLYYELVL